MGDERTWTIRVCEAKGERVVYKEELGEWLHHGRPSICNHPKRSVKVVEVSPHPHKRRAVPSGEDDAVVCCDTCGTGYTTLDLDGKPCGRLIPPCNGTIRAVSPDPGGPSEEMRLTAREAEAVSAALGALSTFSLPAWVDREVLAQAREKLRGPASARQNFGPKGDASSSSFTDSVGAIAWEMREHCSYGRMKPTLGTIHDWADRLEEDLEAAEARAERAERVLEQWPAVALALVNQRPVRNLDELIVATKSALASLDGGPDER